MTTKTIPLQAVHDALAFAVVRHKRPSSNLARFAAYTSYPSPFAPSCADPHRLHRLNAEPRLHIGPLQRGDMERLLRRHRTASGLPAVRKTWGTGMRQLQAEFATCVLR